MWVAPQVVAVFGEYQAAVAAVGGQGGVPQECSRRLDGALLAVGSLAAILKAKVLPLGWAEG